MSKENMECHCNDPDHSLIACIHVKNLFECDEFLIHGIDVYVCINCNAYWTLFDIENNGGEQ